MNIIGTLGKAGIILAFLSSILSLIYYYRASGKTPKPNDETLGNLFFYLKGALTLVVSALLIWLIVEHQFQFYYVYNYTSKDLAFRYLLSAFYGGQEGSFLLWILISAGVGIGLIRWTEQEYRAPVLFIITLTQLFLLSMLLGLDFGFIKLGASPFRTLAEALPDAPFLKANPNFVPLDGNGLNDLLKSPWMMIHPPILFVGFSLMTVPYAFAMAALWKRKYMEWIRPALPWTLGANLCLLTAIFLGGYWAYVTLSFGGYWAWDPVENASFVPWLFGVAGIHTMLVQRKSGTAQKASILFAILAYMTIVYETFLTRSGVLGDASVHSFVDLGLYNQLIVFMLVISGIGLGLFFYRYKELPTPEKESPVLSREFMMFAGAMMLFLAGFVIILGTSSPIIGRLFTSNPTPPEISFYNNWTLPLAAIMGVLTVLGQYLWWQKHDSESLSTALMWPVVLTAVISMVSIILGDVRNLAYMLLIFTSFFALIGNANIMLGLIKKKPRLIGGTVTHVGFAVMILGIVASSAYNVVLLDDQAKAYNQAVRRGTMVDNDGTPVRSEVSMFVLNKGEPKVIGDNMQITYTGMHLDDKNRPGEQFYHLKLDLLKTGKTVELKPVVYPMLTNSTAESINWSVDPEVYTGWFYDVYLYVGGSSFVEQENERIQRAGHLTAATLMDGSASVQQTVNDEHRLSFKRGQRYVIGAYEVSFENFEQTEEWEKPENSIISVKAIMSFKQLVTGEKVEVKPTFAITDEGGEKFRHSVKDKLPNSSIEVHFLDVKPMSDQIDILITGLEGEIEREDWVVVVADKKPFVSVVWLGTFMLMLGFSISIFRRWADDKRRQANLPELD